MANITVTVTGRSPQDIAETFKTLASTWGNYAGPTADPSPAKDVPAEPAAEEPESMQIQTPVLELETVRARLVELSRAGKQAEIKSILNSVGADKLSDVPSERYAEVLAAAEAIE